MEFVAYARDNADANKPGNYFFTGEHDPNNVLPPYKELVGGESDQATMGELSGSGRTQPDTRWRNKRHKRLKYAYLTHS